MNCGYQWASWQDTGVPNVPSVCDSSGSTSTFHQKCTYVNETHENLIGTTSPPIPTNCGDHYATINYPVEVPTAASCHYTTDKKVYDIDGQFGIIYY